MLDGTPVENDWSDIALVKWNDEGELIWAREIGGDCPFVDREGISQLVYDPTTDELLVTGTYSSTIVLGQDTLLGFVPCQQQQTWMFMTRVSADGEFLWSTHGSGNSVGGRTMVIGQEGEIDLFGTCPYGATLHGPTDMDVPGGGFHARYTADGELLAVERILTHGRISKVDLRPGQDALIAGWFDGSGSLLDANVEVPAGAEHGFLAKADLGAGVDWLVQFRSSQIAYILDCELVGENKVIASGVYWGDLMTPWDTVTAAPGIAQAFIVCLDLEGNFQWITMLTSPASIYTTGELARDLDDRLLLFGSFADQMMIGNVELQASAGRDGFIVEVDTLGECRSTLRFGKVSSGSMRGASSSGDGIYLSCAYDSTLTFEEYTLPHPGGLDRYLMVAKLDSLSGFTGIPPTMTLNGSLTIYANPNNGLCTVELPSSLRPSADLVLSVYDNTGHLVQRTPLMFTEQGLRLDIRALAKGMYHVELGDGRQRYTGRIVFE